MLAPLSAIALLKARKPVPSIAAMPFLLSADGWNRHGAGRFDRVAQEVRRDAEPVADRALMVIFNHIARSLA